MKTASVKKPFLLLTGIVFFCSTTVSAQQTPDSLLSASLPVSKNYLSSRSLVIPISMITIGYAATHNNPLYQFNKNISKEVQQEMPGFATKADDYLKHAPAITLFALSAAGVKGKHQLLGKTIIFLISTELTAEVVKRLKNATHQLRPDGTTHNAFPSGHTATAFVGAEMIHQEYGERSHWYSIIGYTMAGTTGLLRVMNNRHWLRDVIAGAGVGILCTKLGYWAFSKVEKKRVKPKMISY